MTKVYNLLKSIIPDYKESKVLMSSKDNMSAVVMYGCHMIDKFDVVFLVFDFHKVKPVVKGYECTSSKELKDAVKYSVTYDFDDSVITPKLNNRIIRYLYSI